MSLPPSVFVTHAHTHIIRSICAVISASNIFAHDVTLLYLRARASCGVYKKSSTYKNALSPLARANIVAFSRCLNKRNFLLKMVITQYVFAGSVTYSYTCSVATNVLFTKVSVNENTRYTRRKQENIKAVIPAASYIPTTTVNHIQYI